MKKENKSTKSPRNFDSLISKLSEDELLSLQTMSYVRGGDGEGDSGGNIIIIPPPPKQG